MSGVQVIVDDFMQVYEWQFPRTPFVEYDKGDEWWARRYGFGREILVPGAAMIGGVLVMHPSIWERLRKETA